MAESTPSKRILPARERRESAAKRRASSPVPQPSPSSKPTPAVSTEPRQKRKYTKRASLVKQSKSIPGTPSRSTPGTDDTLPTRLVASKPLPTLREKQTGNLSPAEYQSVAESSILAASLHRSRMQWLCESVFKKYWVKPVKRKGVVEAPPNNPDIKSMQRLGNATITIEPHTFDVSFYTVKDPATLAAPYYRHPNQHTAKHAQPTQPQPPPPSSFGVQTPPSHVPSPITPAIPSTSRQDAVPTNVVSIKQEHTETKQSPPTSAKLATSIHTPQPAFTTNGGPPKPNNDPVIQMLAARASVNSRLKDLMKAVAISEATADQLREFQSHIDEFNRVIAKHEANKIEQQRKSTSSSPAPHNSAQPQSTPNLSPTIHSANPPPPPPTRPTPGIGPFPSPLGRGGPLQMHPPPYAAYPTPPRPEPIIKHIVMEFTSAPTINQAASTDRWLFPDHAVLEMRSGGMEMIASFFAEKKGQDIINTTDSTDAENGESAEQKWKAETEYYQPVTMVIKATQHRTIETIARAARPLVEVQSYMKEVMEKKTRAPQEYLAYRLAREKSLRDVPSGDFADSAIEMSDAEEDELREFYGI